MLEHFLEEVIGLKFNEIKTVEDRVFLRNKRIMIPASILVICVSLYWTIIDLFTDNYNLDLIAKIGVYAQLISSIIALIICSRKNKLRMKTQRILFVVYYYIIILGVSILIATRNIRVIASGNISNDMGVSVSAFYMFLMAFMPLPHRIDSYILCFGMVLGLVLPDIIFHVSTYSLFCHIVLASCFVALYFYYSAILLESSYNENTIAELNNKLLKHAYCDALTDVLNRRSMDAFIQYLNNKKNSKKIGIIFFDIDFFKRYNDFYGHAKGDVVLRDVARTVENYIAAYSNSYLFRYGGEEFVAVIDNPDEKTFKKIISGIRTVVDKKRILRDDIEEFDHITVTTGGAIENLPNITGDYVSQADNQLYLGKNTKRNCAFYNNKAISDSKIDSSKNFGTNRSNYIMNKVLANICEPIVDIYSVNCVSHKVSVYRHDGNAMNIDRIMDNQYDYHDLVEQYCQANVHPLDKDLFLKKMDFKNVYSMVKANGSYNIYYRVLRGGKTLFFKLNCTPSAPIDEFDAITYSFLPEDVNISEEQVEKMLEIDELTGVYTKQAFLHYARKYINDHPDSNYSLIISDIENFRMQNRIYGDKTCDNIIRYLSNAYRYQNKCKVIGRASVDQFIMLYETDEYFDHDAFAQIAEKVKNGAPVFFLNLKYGICKDFKRSEDISSIYDKAMLALRNIKHIDNRPIAYYDHETALKQDREQMFETRFEEAIAKKEFVVQCQPKYKASNKEVAGAEALVRWRDENGHYIPPREFIPVFEKNGTIAKLDEYVFEEVCKIQKDFKDKGLPLLPISVNLSRSSVFQAKALEKYSKIIKKYGIDKSLVPVEITESSAIENPKIKELAEKLRNAGFKLHMDDFGVGYSSISSLIELPVDVVKLDKTLIDNIGNMNGDEILRHIVELAHFLKMEVVAEGVEDEEQYYFMKALNCDIIQGFYFARNIEIKEYEKILKKVNSKKQKKS